MLIKGVNLSLELYLIFIHLIWVMLQSINFVTDWLFILIKFLEVGSQLIQFKLSIFSLNIFVFVCLKKLLLSILMLFVLVFKISQFSIKFVESIFMILNWRMTFTYFLNSFWYLALFIIDKTLDAENSLLIVLTFCL